MQAAKLWEGLENQKQWYQGQPRIRKIVDNAIMQLRFEIILIAQVSLHPRKFKHLATRKEQFE